MTCPRRIEPSTIDILGLKPNTPHWPTRQPEVTQHKTKRECQTKHHTAPPASPHPHPLHTQIRLIPISGISGTALNIYETRNYQKFQIQTSGHTAGNKQLEAEGSEIGQAFFSPGKPVDGNRKRSHHIKRLRANPEASFPKIVAYVRHLLTWCLAVWTSV